MNDNINVAHRIDARIACRLRIVEIEELGKQSIASGEYWVTGLDFDGTLRVEADQSLVGLPGIFDREATVNAVASWLIGI